MDRLVDGKCCLLIVVKRLFHALRYYSALHNGSFVQKWVAPPLLCFLYGEPSIFLRAEILWRNMEENAHATRFLVCCDVLQSSSRHEGHAQSGGGPLKSW